MLETERKFSLPEGRTLDEVTGDLALGDSREHELQAVYFDTPGLALARTGTTLRRRTGGDDEGWHLKLPRSGDARQEVHVALADAASPLQVPAALRAQVAEVIGWQPLVPVAELATRRTETDLVDGGERVAVLCQDRVTATRAGQSRSWTEAEVEVAGQDDPAAAQATLDRIGAVLLENGAEALASTSKLVQALGDALEARAPRKPSAADVLGAYIAEQVGMIQGREAGARVDAPESVHKMRVATRRLRSTLRTFRGLLDAERTEALRAEVGVLAAALGGPRDAEVLKERLVTSLRELPREAVQGPVRSRVRKELDARHQKALADLVTYLDSPRYRRLMDDLVTLVVDPAFLEAADAPAKKVLPPLLERSTRRVTRLWKAAEKGEGAEQLELAHEARKKAKAARYAFEAVAGSLKQGNRAAHAWTEVTEALGVAQDTVVARARLRELARIAARNDEPTFTYGVLWQRELAHQDAAHDVAAAAIAKGRKASGTSKH